jgi:hypothetical protein
MTTFNLSQYITGDTWSGIPAITITRNGSALDLTGATAEIHVRFQIDAPTVVLFTTENNSILILDPPINGILQVPPQIVNVPPANYIWSLKVTLANGEVDTFVSGKWPIVKTA